MNKDKAQEIQNKCGYNRRIEVMVGEYVDLCNQVEILLDRIKDLENELKEEDYKDLMNTQGCVTFQFRPF